MMQSLFLGTLVPDLQCQVSLQSLTQFLEIFQEIAKVVINNKRSCSGLFQSLSTNLPLTLLEYCTGDLPEGLFRELPDAEVVDKTEFTEDDFVWSGGDLDELQKQLEALNAF